MGLKNRLFFFFIWISVGGVSDPVFRGNGALVKLITELDIGETSNIHLLHADLLWVGHSVVEEGTFNRMEVYDLGGVKKGEIRLPHSLDSIARYDEDTVLVTGRTKPPPVWLTYYSLLRFQNGALSVSTYTFPEQYQVTGFVRAKNQMLFSVIDNFILSLPQFSKVGKPISLPGKMLPIRDDLFVVEREISSPLTHLTKLNLQTGQKKRTFDRWRLWITNLLYLEHSNLLAVSESGDDQVLLIDPESNKLVHAFPFVVPRGLEKLGRCLFVSSQGSKKVALYEISRTGSRLLKEWDLSFVGEKLGNTKLLALDSKSHKLFIRGLNPSSRGASFDTQSIVISVEFEDPIAQWCR